MERIDAAIAIVVRNGKILICQRMADDVLGGFWEFPGGKCEDGESLEECSVRELYEEVRIVAEARQALRPIDHSYPHGRVRLHPFICAYTSGEPELIECQAACWIEPQELVGYTFPPANESLIAEVIEHLSRSSNG